MPRGQRRRQPTAEGRRQLQVFLDAPESPDADQLMDVMVQNLNHSAFEAVAAAGLIMHPNWPRWHRAMQVRFLQHAAAERLVLEQAIRSELQGGRRPSPETLMKAVIRVCVMDISRWFHEQPRSSLTPPSGPDHFWRQAQKSLDRDINIETAAGRTLESAPLAWYELLGVDYSMDSVPNHE